MKGEGIAPAAPWVFVALMRLAFELTELSSVVEAFRFLPREGFSLSECFPFFDCDFVLAP